MKALHKRPSFDRRTKTLVSEGASLPALRTAIDRLRRGQALKGDNWNHHKLTGPLQGMESAVVGQTNEGRTVVMVFVNQARRLELIYIDEHDAAYRTLIEEVKGKRSA